MNDFCCSRNELDGNAPRPMLMGYIEIENMTTG
jgi:hypothetical protein